MRPKLCLLAPNEDIAHTAENVIKEREFNCDILIGNLKTKGIELAKQALKAGCEAIISRGGTFLRIQEEITEIPAVQIKVSTIDLLKALHAASYFSYKVGVVGYSNTIYEASSVGKYLKLEIIEIPIDSSIILQDRLKEEVNQGLEVIVGDTMASNLASNLGIQGILIASGKRAIYEALSQAEDLAILRRKEAISQQRISTILNKLSEGILATDSGQRITHCNPAAEKFLGLSAGDMLNKNIEGILNGAYNNNELITIKGQQYILTIEHIQDHGVRNGEVFTLKPVKEIQDMETKLRRKQHSRGLIAKYTFNDIVGQSESLIQTIHKAKRISKSSATVLIIGKTGVGKEMFAQSIHNESPRNRGPFVAVNCAALPESILESELFGYVEGSFTDANKGGKMGLFELAHRGTIFLDEIGDMSLSVQAKVLRVIQEKEVVRLGGDRVIPVDIRVIAATNVDLWDAVNDGRFRQDLYYRINVLRVDIPSLSERGQDALLLTEFFLNKLNPSIQVKEGALKPLLDHDWPGNVRELYNFVEQITVLQEDNALDESAVRKFLAFSVKGNKVSNAKRIGNFSKRLTDEEILETLEQCRGNQAMTCEILGINRSTLWRRLKKLEVNS
ncbi:transcriptional regulator containing PAS, AAA-type ATPase, and DNA-binding domains [Desulfosporosinus orientis DSM 765]|uniref:Transcriptional regulator containing PAS, AAA-type ATPase, and DNA-binding domains n=1 Tax=Desulfosporosinus orientis (strain ATCC 19365 / DSM 765 / NCIMB 8382 / VKM B-1628 / Singapore I) TaxID=768706 RepID=G7WI94_DESOD|nr:sigma-54-dependent Fis family transcriptional regulator [Desulfosporosinus orientis]AET68542.1 transcriptional regulator containing PAS, AAA-type ATPase, and DNA-binding domains [Desulfosporosinus orientis DSM 765]